MSKDQFLNIVAFLILIGEGGEFFGKAPDYVIEKWDRYIRVPPPVGPAWQWGLDGNNMALLNAYCLRWKIQLDELFPTTEERGSEQ